MPARSKAKATGAALAAKRGERSSTLMRGSRSMLHPTIEKQLQVMASTPRKGKPEQRQKPCYFIPETRHFL